MHACKHVCIHVRAVFTDHLIEGRGSPLILHSNTVVSPSMTARSGRPSSTVGASPTESKAQHFYIIVCNKSFSY